jgi:hypothetical protein
MEEFDLALEYYNKCLKILEGRWVGEDEDGSVYITLTHPRMPHPPTHTWKIIVSVI